MRLAPLASALVVVLSARVASADEAPAPRPRTSPAIEALVAVGATTLASPAVLVSARALGTATPELATSALPAVLVMTSLPPAVATGALFLERRREGAGTRVLPTYLVGLGTQLLVVAGAVLAKTWVADTKDLLVLSAVQGVAVGGATTLAAELSF